MALKTILETLDGVEDTLQPFYVENDGKYVLQIEGVDEHPDVANLRNAYQRTKADREQAKTELKTLAQQLADMQANRPDEAQLVAMRQELENRAQAEAARAAELEARLMGVTRDRSLDEALAAAGITNPTYLKAARALLAPQVKVDGDRAIIETDMGPMALQEHVKRWVASEGQPFVTPPSGGGARGNTAGSVSKTISRDDFEAMDPVSKMAAIREGKTIAA
jgi:non-ribosomal peptide synthetase component F